MNEHNISKKALVKEFQELKQKYSSLQKNNEICLSKLEKTENKLKESNTIIDNFFNESQEFTGIIEIFADKNDLRYIRINRSAGNYLNMSPDTVEGKLGSEVGVSEDTLKFWISKCLESEQSGSSVKFEYNRGLADGLHTLRATISVLQPPLFSFIVSDISDYLQLQQGIIKAKNEAEENEKKYRGIFEFSNIGIATGTLDGTLTDINKEFQDILGYSRTELLHMNFAESTHPDDLDKEIDLMNQLLKGEIESYHIEKRYIHKLGEVIWIDISVAGIKNMNSKIIQFVGMAKDITKRKKAEEDLLIAKEKAEESNRLKTEFLNNMSHEIRTPMNGIIGFSEMFENKDITEEKRKYYAKIVQNSSLQLLHIIDDILEISSLETKQVKLNETEFSLNDFLMELFAIFDLKAKQRNLPLYLKKALSDEQSTIISDKTKLNKVMGNLLENAFKYTNEGYIEFGYFINKNKIVLYVKDTGIGIAPENYKYIFERFTQENKDISCKHGGLGLGLSIAKENAQLLGGSITLESNKGKGSTFFVTIPYNTLEIHNGNMLDKIVNKQIPDDKYTILVAEDEQVNYLYIEALIEQDIRYKYHLIHAVNGKEAVELCTRNNDIDLVLMDIKMPIMNGLEAAKEIKSKFPNLPIIAQTAYSTESDRQLALNNGCDNFISKPINKKKLFGMLYKYQNLKQ